MTLTPEMIEAAARATDHPIRIQRRRTKSTLKPRIKLSSVRWLLVIDEHIRHCDIRGPFSRFNSAAADPLDGLAYRDELEDLIRRGFLTVVPYEASSGFERDRRLCGTSWSVNPTEMMVRLLWPDRLLDQDCHADVLLEIANA